MTRYFSELRRRNVFRIAAVYIVGGWLLLQVADVLFDAMTVPEWAMRLVLALLVLGFVPALVFAWVFELTPEGIKREKDIVPDESITHQTGRRLDRLILVVLAAAVVALLVDRSFNMRDSDAPPGSEVASSRPGGPTQDVLSKQSALSIAVLPFANRSADAADEFFVEGIHDDILTQLAKIGALRVISRTSVMQYKDTIKTLGQVGRELGVGNVVEGAVQRAGDRVRVTVQLIDTGTDEHIWAENYDRELTAANIFAIQSEVAGTIARALEASLTPGEQRQLARRGTENLAAYELYMQGRYLFHRRSQTNLFPAVEKFQAAVAADPDFAAAWAGLASALVVIPAWTNLPREEFDRKGREAAMRAIALDPSLGEPYGTLAGQAEEGGRWLESEEGFQKALGLEPNNATVHQWYGELLSDVGLVEASIGRFDTAQALDPVSHVLMIHKAFSLIAAGREEEARRLADQAMQLVPGSSWSRLVVAQVALRHGRVTEARSLLQEIQGQDEELWPEILLVAMEDPARVPEALAFLEQSVRQRDSDPYFIILGYAYLGAWDAFFQQAESIFAFQPSAAKIMWHPELAPVRRDPRFKTLVQRVGLLDYWRAHGWPDACHPEGDTFSCQ
jgi:TolB-like protein/Flp pilus assembly protein TadD